MQAKLVNHCKQNLVGYLTGIGEQFDALQQQGHEVLTEHFGLESLKDTGDSEMRVNDIYDRDMKWLKAADMVVAEVTNPSLGVGYELGWAEQNQKSAVCLFRPESGRSLSAMVRGSKHFRVIEYSEDDDMDELINKVID